MKKGPSETGLYFEVAAEPAQPGCWLRPPVGGGAQSALRGASYAALNQYPALNGLLMRSARGDTSTSLSVGIFSPASVVNSMPETGVAPGASFARSAWLFCAERATEKNRNT